MQIPRLYSWIFDDTPFSGLYLKTLGAQIGSNASVEQPCLLESDLVSIGDNCVAEFEVQFATAEIRGGYLELRQAHIGNNAKLGTRAAILGGAYIHDGCDIATKATVDFSTSTTEPCQVIVGSPATIIANDKTDGGIWRPKRSWAYSVAQIIGMVVMVEILTGVGYIGSSIGLVVRDKFGSI